MFALHSRDQHKKCNTSISRKKMSHFCLIRTLGSAVKCMVKRPQDRLISSVARRQGGGCNVPTLASVLSSRNVGTLKANVVFQQCGGHGVPTVCVVFQRCSNGVPTVFQRCSNGVRTVFPQSSQGFLTRFPTVFPRRYVSLETFSGALRALHRVVFSICSRLITY